MKAVLEDLRSGEVNTYEVPEPELRPGGILVRTAYSAISAGTERAKVETSEKSLLGRAMARPDLVKQVVEFARTNGVKAAYQKVQTRLGALSTMGYSCAGTVIGVGEGVTDFSIGDRVACAGGGYANHCEVNWIPSNLAVLVPESVPLDAASLTTIGAIAMQGLRQAQVTFGENVVVIGAGLVGILTIQLARAAGCRVIAVDRDEARVDQAASCGAHLSLLSSDPQSLSKLNEFSRYGADAVVVTAATSSAEPLELAAKLLRDRGRIVVVGSVGMGVSREHMYHKELSLALSRSYGPGRYDSNYEEGGHDYPIGFVRWTERRNMQAFLDFLANGSIDVSPLLEHRTSAHEGGEAYKKLLAGGVYTVILDYLLESARADTLLSAQVPRSLPKTPGQLRVGCIGAGGFASTYIFPNLRAHSQVVLEAVATASGVAAESARRNFGFARALGPKQLITDPTINAIFIASRHQSHAEYVAAGVRNEKAVFVEKPLAVDEPQLEMIQQAFRESRDRGHSPYLMIGFNRRFAPFTNEIRRFFQGRQEPMMVHIRVNAGFIPREHWVQQPTEGGRIIGELCHFVDWARHMVGAKIRTVSAFALADTGRYSRDNVAVGISFADGSVGNLIYVANGDPAVPKEYFEVFCGGGIARLEDFKTLEFTRNRKSKHLKAPQDKGHRRELQLTLDSMKCGTDAPIPFEEIVEVTEAMFSIAAALRNGQSTSPVNRDGNVLKSTAK